MKQRADWLAWVLQGLFGMGAGSLVGLALRSGISDGPTFSDGAYFQVKPENLPLFLWGTALIGGAIASQWGDRLWLHNAYLLAQPDAPHQNRASRILSLFLGVEGIALVLRSHPVFDGFRGLF